MTTISKTVFAEYQITKKTQDISVSVLFIKKTDKLKGFMQEKDLCFFPWGKGLLLLRMLFLESHVFILGAVLVHIVSHHSAWELSVPLHMQSNGSFPSPSIKAGKRKTCILSKRQWICKVHTNGECKDFQWSSSHCNSSSDAARVPTERTLSV